MKRTYIMRNMLIGIGITVLFFVCIELFLRCIPGTKRFGPERFNGGREDHSLFWKADDILRVPVDDLRYKNEFRGKVVSVKKTASVIRIICLGGSFTYAWPYENPSVAYPFVCETILNKNSSDQAYEVINAGIGGYTSYQGLLYFKQRLLRMDPDVLTICFGANDSNNNYEIEVFCTDKEYYERLESMRKHSVVWDIFELKQLLNNFRLVGLLDYGKYLIKKIFIKAKQRVPPEEFKNNLLTFIEYAQKYKFQIVFIYEPHINLKKPSVEVASNPYYQIMKTLSAQYSQCVSLVDTITLCKQYDDNKMFYDEMHLTPFGHKKLAEKMAEVLLRNVLPRKYKTK